MLLREFGQLLVPAGSLGGYLFICIVILLSADFAERINIQVGMCDRQIKAPGTVFISDA